jgi:murein DD-endopeptidase MepM/ murein hydrolase activator NlpD
VNPALIGALEAPELRPLDSGGGQVVPVGAWMPAGEDARLVLPTGTPHPTRTPTFTPTPTLTPVPTITPVPTLTTTLVPSLTATLTPTPWPTLPPVTHIIPTPTRSLENCAPAGMPLSGPLTQRFHYRHIGIDIGVPIGTPVLTTHSGRVTYAGWSTLGYGNLVVVENGRFITYYGHFDAVYVTVGQWVDSGTVLGLSGNTGNSTGPHLHYETRIDNVPVDPLTFELRGYPHC